MTFRELRHKIILDGIYQKVNFTNDFYKIK